MSFPTEGLNPGLPHCRQALYCLSHQGSGVGLELLSAFHVPHSKLQAVMILSPLGAYVHVDLVSRLQCVCVDPSLV